MRIIISFLLYLFGVNQVFATGQCSTVFPDGASTHSAGGTISFGFNSQVIDSDDNLLATTSISKNAGSNKDTCNTADCVATGMAADATSAISFQTTVSTEDVNLAFKEDVDIGSGSYSGNEYRDINPGSSSQASITFLDTHSEYYVDRLVLGFKNTLYLQAGATYWFDQLILGSQVDIVVQGSGTAIIYVNQSVSFTSPTYINSPSNKNSGDASKLVMYVFSDVTFLNNSTYSGSLYAQGDITFGSSSYAFGAVSANNIQLDTNSTITYQGAEVADSDYGNLCESPPPPLCEVTPGTINSVGLKIDNTGSNSQINNTTEAQAIHAAWLDAGSPVSGLINGGTYNVAASGSSEVDRIDFGGSNHDFSGTLPYPGAGSGVSGSDFLVHTSGTLSLPAGAYTIFVESDDGFSFVMDTLSGDNVSFNKFGSSSSGASNELRFENPTGNSNTGGSFTLSQNSVFDISAIFFERGGGDYLEISIANSIRSNSAPSGYEVLRDGALSNKVKFGRCPKAVALEYHFDELSWDGTFNEVIDNTNFNNHGTAQGALNTTNNASAISGPIGTCSYGEFDGVDDYVAMGNPDSLNFTGEITLAAWIRPDRASGHMNIIAHGLHVNPNQEIIFRILDGNYQVGVWNGSDHLATSNIPASDVGAGNWVHLAGTYDGTTWRLYRNGVELSSTTDSNGAMLVTADWAIGANGSGNDSFFEGGIDEPRIYSEALTASEISELMNETRTCPLPPAPLCGIEGDSLYAIGIKITNGGSNSQINNTTEALAIHAAWLDAGSPVSGLINGGTYNVAASGTSEVDRIDFGGSNHDFSGTLPYPGAGTGVSGSDFLVHTSGTLSLPAGAYTIFVESDDGFSFVMDTLSGDDVSFNKFGSSSSGANNELRFENPTGNSNTGGSFTLNQDSVFDISAIFFERGGGDYLEISIANNIRTNSAPAGYEVLRHGALSDMVKFGQCAVVPQVDHYRIEHDTQGFTCEAETLSIKACANESCNILYDQETSITLSPSGWAGGNTLVFTGEFTTNLSVTDESTVTLAKMAASPEADLRCFNGGTETCDITFSNDGFEIFGANVGDNLPDQLAANNFSNVNLRAVRSNNNVCEVLLEGTQEISLTYDCNSPNQCLTPLNGISISGDGTGGNTGNIEVEFNELGIASLDILNYPDAGRLSLSVRAEVEGVTITNSDIESVDVYPSYLALSVEQTELIYSAVGNQNNYVAGENFTFVIGAYGTNDQLLPNYQADTPQLKVTRVAPIGAAENGSFKYSQSSESTTSGTFTTTPNISSSTADDHFVMGEYRFNEAYYTEVGRIELDVKDLDYLGNEIISNGVLTLGDFYPAYFNVALTNTPTLADSCSNTFSYLGQSINFETAPELSLTAYNAIGTKTLNYSDVYWNYLPDETTLETYLSFLDSSTYAKDDSATVIELGDEPVITNNDNYDGSGTVTINNSNFQYNKVNPNDDSVFDPALVSPFEANITLNFASDFFFGNFIDQNGNEDTICYQANHTDSTCLGLDIENVTGTQIRYGRIALLSTYGPETESLNVPIQAEYYNLGQWLVNKEDSCTSIAFDESANHLELLPSGESDITGDISNISSTGMLLIGVADDSGDLFINAPDTVGEVKLQLDPMNDPSGWSDYLNYDWNADGFINADDHPEGTITFGRFRGNDRIIHWREVFN